MMFIKGKSITAMLTRTRKLMIFYCVYQVHCDEISAKYYVMGCALHICTQKILDIFREQNK